MFDEDDLLPLSALQHLAYCERRAALVLLEAVWADNAHTAQGVVAHQKVHQAPSTESRGNQRTARGLWVRSLRLGLAGKTDVVEFHRAPDIRTDPGIGISLPGAAGLWRPFPVEYKSGARRHESGYEQQLCAQALCLEEMLHTSIPAGALFYGKSGRRLDVAFSPILRAQTEAGAARLHQFVSAGITPAPVNDKRCPKCSLLAICLPNAAGRSASGYLRRMLRAVCETAEQQ
jgi:CRISPR-associated exonuclease Cas4